MAVKLAHVNPFNPKVLQGNESQLVTELVEKDTDAIKDLVVAKLTAFSVSRNTRVRHDVPEAQDVTES